MKVTLPCFIHASSWVPIESFIQSNLIKDHTITIMNHYERGCVVLERIYPVCAETIWKYIGRPVYAVMQDGSSYYGVIESVNDGILVLRSTEGTGAVSTNAKKSTVKLKAQQKAKMSAYFPRPFLGSRIALSLALIALLFSTPFLGFPFFF